MSYIPDHGKMIGLCSGVCLAITLTIKRDEAIISTRARSVFQIGLEWTRDCHRHETYVMSVLRVTATL